jgi:hypothetical protein
VSWRSILLCVAGIASFGPVAAAGEAGGRRALIEEFLTAEPSYVQRRGEFELSSAFDLRKPGDGWRVPVLVEYGITDRLEAEVEAMYHSVPGDGARNRGPGDVELGLHYALRRDVRRVAVTLGADIGLPAGDETRGLGAGEAGVELFGIAGLELGRSELHVTGRVEVEDEKIRPALDAAAVVPRGDFRFTLEANVLSGEEGSGARPAQPPLEGEPAGETEDLLVVVTPGLFHRPGPEIEYGLGVPIGLTGAAPDWGIIGRLTIEF